MNKHHFDYTEFVCLTSISYSLLCSVADREKHENMLQIYKQTPMQKRDFNKVALHLHGNHASA